MSPQLEDLLPYLSVEFADHPEIEIINQNTYGVHFLSVNKSNHLGLDVKMEGASKFGVYILNRLFAPDRLYHPPEESYDSISAVAHRIRDFFVDVFDTDSRFEQMAEMTDVELASDVFNDLDKIYREGHLSAETYVKMAFLTGRLDRQEDSIENRLTTYQDFLDAGNGDD